MRKSAALYAVALPLLVSAVACGQRQSNGVFVMTNNSNRNTVTAFTIDSHGKLVSAGQSVGTEGKGSGSSINPLGSQGSLAVSKNGNWLFALNAGSNEISVFRINNNKLSFVSKTSSLGQFPASIATYGNQIFVLNKKGTPPSITGFTNKNGVLIAIDKEKAVRQLPPGTYTQIGISPNGKWLVVSNESANTLLVYALTGDTLTSSLQTLATSGSSPAAFAFDKRNNLLVVGSSSGTVSSYSLSTDGITVITSTLSTGQTMPRWIVCNGDYAYTSTSTSNIITALAVNNSGQLTIINTYSSGSNSTTELAISPTGNYLYTFDPRTNTIYRFHVNSHGELTAVDNVIDFFGVAAQGIAAS